MSVLFAWIKKNSPLALWLLFLAVMVGWALAASHRPITYIYWNAARDWWAGKPIYGTEGIHGFIYFPSSVFLFAPFSLLPVTVADHLWRLLSAAGLAFGMFRLVRAMEVPDGDRVAQVALALAIPTLSINVLRSQWELTMFAILLHALADLLQGKDVRSGLLFALAVAVKPLALIPGFFLCCLRLRAMPAFLLGMVGVVFFPFLHPDPAFVADQYAAMIPKLLRAANPEETPWFDLVNLFRAFDFHPSYAAMTEARLAFAAILFGLGLWMVQKRDQKTAFLIGFYLIMAYLALFNPRTEEGTYANIALLLGVFAGLETRIRGSKIWAFFLFCLVAGLCTHFAPSWIYRPSQYWIKQAITTLSLGYIAWLLIGARSLVKR